MKTFLKIFNWLSLSSSDAVKNSIESCQTRQRHGNDTATTRQRVLTTGLSYRKIAILTLLLTLGVGQMWAGAGLYEVYFEYSYNSLNKTKTCTSSSGESNDLGILTADFKLKSIYPKVWKDGSGNICGCLMEYYISSDQELTGFTYDKSLGGNNHQWKRTTAFTVAQYNTGASGSYTFWYRFKAWGSSSSSSNCGDNNYYIPSDGSSKNKFTYKIAPPAVSSFAVSTTGSNILSGSGTSGDPYIIAYKGNLVLTLSGNKGRTDANSSLQYNTSGTWNSTTSRTISSITSTTKTSVTVKMRCYNSTASLSGTESTKTIYYKSEPSYSVTFADDGNGSVTAPASSPKTVGQNSGIVINASANSGYSFDRWTISSGSGSFTLAATTASNTFKPTAASTITATFKPDWALYNGSTLLGIFTKVSSTQYTLSVDLSKENHHQLQFKKDGATGYIVGAEDPTSTFRNLSSSTGYFDWANIQNVVTGTYFITLKYESSTWKYKAEQKYTLTYDANGATSGTAPVDGSSPYLPNTAITTAGNSGSLAKSSFNFTGWNTQPDGQGTHYNASTANAFNINANTTLYAEWTPNVPSSACLAGDFGSVTMNKSTSGSTTTFTYTFYDKAAGTYNFYLKDCSSNTALLKATNGVTMTQTGCTSIASTGASNYYFRVVTGAAGDITITATYNTSAKTINMDVTRVAIDAVTPSWWLIGDAALFTNWNTNNHNYPLNRSYRGMSDVFYRVVDFGGNSTAYFKPLNGNTRYGQTSGSNRTVVTGTQYAITNTDADGTAFKANGQGVVWCVVDQTNKKFWEQTPTTYYTITLANGSSGDTGNGVAGTEGTVTLTTNNLGNLKTKQYASGERVNISVSAKTGYYVDDITIGATSVATDVLASSYSGYTTMPSGNTTLTVTYKPLYSVTFGVGTGMSSYGSVSNSLSISSGTKVLTGTSITFTATPNLGYKFVGWYSDASCTSSVSTDNPYTFSVTAATKLYAKFEYRNLYIHADFISNWATPAQMTQSTVNRAVYTYTVNNMAILASAQVGDAWNTGYHFHFVNTVANPNDNKAYNYNGVQTPTYSGSSIDGVHKTHTDNPTIEFGLTRKSNVTITLTLQSIDDATKPTVNIAADPIYSITHGDPTHGSYTIKVGSASAVGTSTESVAGTTITLAATPATGYHFDSWTVTKAGGGTVTVTSNQFTMPSNDVTVAATFLPNTYDVILNKNGATSGSNQTVTATFDAAMPTTLKGGGDIVAPSKTGYTFSGYTANSNGSGTQYYTAGLLSNHVWDVATNNTNIYAKWSANTYRVTFDVDEENHGTIAGATGYQDVTYDGSTTTVPNRPTAANGYAFMGYYTDQGGEGLKVINADGTWIASVSGYTDGSKKWKYAGDVTLYAYYKKAEIAVITFDNAVVESNGTVSFAVTVSPTPVGDTKLCFTVLHSNDNPLAEQPTITYNGGTGKYSFTAPEASGTYKVEAVLRTGSSCAGGTELDTEVANFQVAGKHTVTVLYKCGDDVIKAATTVTGRPLEWSDAITAPEIFGYTFSGWTTGDGVTLTDDNGMTTKVSTNEATIKIKAIYDGSLIASYAQKKLIYFKNTLGWSDVYVNFHTANAWNNTGNGSGSPKGVGNSGLTNRNKHMIQIGETDVWYYDYGYNDGGSSITPSLYVSFTNKSRDGVSEFWAENPGIDVVYPANYPDAISTDKSSENGFKAATPMFVPLESQEAKPINVGGGGKANYYNAGYWTKYTPGTGYTLEIYNSAGNVLLKSVEFTSEDELMPMKAVVDLEAGQTYKYQLRRGGTDSYGIYYGNSGTMTYANHGSPTPWDMSNGSFSMCGITTNAAGDYTFNLSYSGHAAVNPHYRLRMAVDYPIASGDYRVIYKDNVKSYWKPSAIVPKVNNGKDTVSFFIRPGNSPALKIQTATVNGSTGAITWGSDVNVTSSISSLTKDSVYNICLTMNGSGAISVENVEAYTGNYYIRVDAANSKWDNYRSDPDHLMTYSEYSITHGGYSHYYCHWVDKNDAGRKNVKFCIANDYSPCISDTLTRETASGDWTNITYYIESNGDLKRNANVRFMWNRHDNTISRAYVDGAQDDLHAFLVLLSGDNKIKNQAGGDPLTEVTFKDNENWIYEANVKAQPNALIKLKSTWGESNTITQYFKGSSSSTEKLIGGSGTDWYDIRLLYDFKTNRLIASFVPTDQNITSENAIEADIMFIREHQGDIAQLTFGESGKISKINTAYGVMRFNKWTLANKEKTGEHDVLGSPASIYERSLFWISFPFRVKLSEVFGFGTYGEHWAIQRYDGAARAAKGHFQENGSFWRWMNRNTEYLEPNQGYLLAIDLDLLDENSDVWGPNSRSEQIELFFPSYGTMPDITDADVAQTIPSHECTINWYEEGKVPGPDTGDPRTSYNRTIFDSHWNVMSVPTYVNTDDVSFANTTWTAKKPSFLYTWNADDNTITATSASGYTYHAMHAYMAQYAGGITWTASSGSPASIVARKTYEEQPKEVEFRLELQQNEKMIDQTFVILSNDEEVSADFQFGEDLTKEFNASKASIYTFIPNVATVAGNTLPMSNQTTTVPVGVDVKANGDYTFAMPAGTSGIGVTLIDNETGVRTNLGLMDYTVTLTAGTYDQRFVLEIPAIQQTPTGVEEVTGDGLPVTGARKVLIDNKLYIIKGDKVYDARGAKVQ